MDEDKMVEETVRKSPAQTRATKIPLVRRFWMWLLLAFVLAMSFCAALPGMRTSAMKQAFSAEIVSLRVGNSGHLYAKVKCSYDVGRVSLWTRWLCPKHLTRATYPLDGYSEASAEIWELVTASAHPHHYEKQIKGPRLGDAAFPTFTDVVQSGVPWMREINLYRALHGPIRALYPTDAEKFRLVVTPEERFLDEGMCAKLGTIPPWVTELFARAGYPLNMQINEDGYPIVSFNLECKSVVVDPPQLFK